MTESGEKKSREKHKDGERMETTAETETHQAGIDPTSPEVQTGHELPRERESSGSGTFRLYIMVSQWVSMCGRRNFKTIHILFLFV